MFKYIVDEDIELRLLELKHAEEDFTLIDRDRKYLRAWLPWVDSTTEVKDIENFISSTLKDFADNNGFTAGIWYQGKMVGIISLMGVSWIHRNTSIGYWLGSEYTGKGIMTKACRAIVDYAFNELELHRVEIQCAEKNVKSRAIPERLGFTEEGRIRESEFLYDHYVTHVVYGMINNEWQTLMRK